MAINPAVAISGVEMINQWYYNPAYFAIMSNCANSQMGVWSENSPDRTVVVAVYGQPDRPSGQHPRKVPAGLVSGGDAGERSDRSQPRLRRQRRNRIRPRLAPVGPAWRLPTARDAGAARPQ